MSLGAPLITVELTDFQLDLCINNALEIFSKYVSLDQNFLFINLETYVEGVGLTLPDNVISIFSMTDQGEATSDFGNIFSADSSMLYSAMNLQTPLPRNFSFVTMEIAAQWMDMIKMFTGKGMDFNYNERTKILTLYPDPIAAHLNHRFIVIGVHTLRPEDQLYGEFFVKRYALAEAKILLGTIRKKFSSMQLIGGGTVDASIHEQGITERDKLLEDIQKNESPVFGFAVG